jgi:hypothetical protein
MMSIKQHRRNGARGAAGLLGVLSLTPAIADDWGCQVLLCLADPRGARTETECQPPIDRLYRHLRRGGAFPTCDLAGSPTAGGSWAQPVVDPYEPCPAGLRPAPANTWVTGRRTTGVTDPPAVSEPLTTGVGPRACVGTPLKVTAATPVDTDGHPVAVTVYDTVVWQSPASPRAIDVYVDGRWQQRVRY